MSKSCLQNLPTHDDLSNVFPWTNVTVEGKGATTTFADTNTQIRVR